MEDSAWKSEIRGSWGSNFEFRFSDFEFRFSVFHFRFSIFRFSIFEFRVRAGVSMRIRRVSDDDLEAIISIQNKTPQASRWTQADYANLTGDPLGLILVAELDTMTPPKIVGFAAFYRVIDEAELRNMAVDPAHQRQGVGRALFAEGRRRLLEQGVRQIYLEVRASNISAQRLYYSAGFSLRSRRRDYYYGPREDGLVLSLNLSA
jgi:ribosomal-protein-alanine N-acetyltransferase